MQVTLVPRIKIGSYTPSILLLTQKRVPFLANHDNILTELILFDFVD